MDRMLEGGLLIFGALGLTGLAGVGDESGPFGRRSAPGLLAALGLGAVLLYSYSTERAAEHRTQRIHDCAIAKVATAKCTSAAPKHADLPKGAAVISKGDTPWTDYAKHPNEVVWDVCPPYWLSDTPTSGEENAAIAAAEEECAGEVDPKQKSLHEQLVEYRKVHGIVQEAKSKTAEGASVPHDHWEDYAVKKLNSKECAAKVRAFYPGAYDDLDDATLTKKVLAKYPTYCDVSSSPPDFIPVIKDIR